MGVLGLRHDSLVAHGFWISVDGYYYGHIWSEFQCLETYITYCQYSARSSLLHLGLATSL